MGMRAADWLKYANQGATRNDPISSELFDALSSYIPDMGLTVEVFSGGQENNTTQGLGSTRHNHGNAADVFFYENGRQLDWADPNDQRIFQEIVSRGKQAGITGWGAGPGYMRPGSMHLGFGNPAVWGAGGKSANAPAWLREAFYNGVAPRAAQTAALDAANAQAARVAPVPAPTIQRPSIENTDYMNALVSQYTGGPMDPIGAMPEYSELAAQMAPPKNLGPANVFDEVMIGLGNTLKGTPIIGDLMGMKDNIGTGFIDPLKQSMGSAFNAAMGRPNPNVGMVLGRAPNRGTMVQGKGGVLNSITQKSDWWKQATGNNSGRYSSAIESTDSRDWTNTQ